MQSVPRAWPRGRRARVGHPGDSPGRRARARDADRDGGRIPERAATRACSHDGIWVAEIVYRPLETELLRAARERGCRTLDGGGMVVFQAAASLELFTGAAPDRERMLRHFAELTA